MLYIPYIVVLLSGVSAAKRRARLGHRLSGEILVFQRFRGCGIFVHFEQNSVRLARAPAGSLLSRTFAVSFLIVSCFKFCSVMKL